MLLKYFTFSVLKLLIFNFVKLLQPKNICFIVVTLEVLKPLRSIFVRPLHPLNSSAIFVTSLVLMSLRALGRLISLLIPLNQANMVVGLTF